MDFDVIKYIWIIIVFWSELEIPELEFGILEIDSDLDKFKMTIYMIIFSLLFMFSRCILGYYLREGAWVY